MCPSLRPFEMSIKMLYYCHKCTLVGRVQFKNAQESLRMLKKVQECQRRKDSKSIKVYSSFLIDS